MQRLSLTPKPLHERLRRLTASVTTGGVMLVGMPLALEYVVRPGDTLSEIAVHHDTTVGALVDRNGLDRGGDRVVAGESLDIPAAHGRTTRESRGDEQVNPDARRIVRYTVRPGDTPSGLAVRFHAWTAEIVERNGSVLRAGEQIEIPVVVAAARSARRTAASDGAPAPAPDAAPPSTDRSPHASPAPSTGSSPSRATVRRVITATARRHGVDPELALAVSWQESGWQMDRVSSARAVGAMQVIPSTGRWMSSLVGRKLRLGDLQDNATAGVMLLGILEDRAPTRAAVAGYYQGLAGVRRHGMYDDTKRYVANVLALQRQFERGEYPA
jgi:soluble lytic murein transglycosylase-like protein